MQKIPFLKWFGCNSTPSLGTHEHVNLTPPLSQLELTCSITFETDKYFLPSLLHRIQWHVIQLFMFQPETESEEDFVLQQNAFMPSFRKQPTLIFSS